MHTWPIYIFGLSARQVEKSPDSRVNVKVRPFSSVEALFVGSCC